MSHGFRKQVRRNRDQFWLTDAQYSKLEPHLPTDTRGKARVGDWRAIGGIIHVLKSGGRWVDAISHARSSRRAAGANCDRQLRGQSRSRGGRATKIHPLTGAQCRPLAFMLTSGQVADCTAAAALLGWLPKCDVLHADKGYDANAIRRQVEERGATPNISRKADRKRGNCFSPFHYCNRSAIERATEAPSSACFAG